MKQPRSASVRFCVAAILIAAGASLGSAYTMVSREKVTAEVTVGAAGNAGGGIALSVPKLLPFQAFFGKDVVIPVEIQGIASAASASGPITATLGGANVSAVGAPSALPVPASVAGEARQGRPAAAPPAGVSMSFVYTLLDPSGNALGPPVTVPIAFHTDALKPNSLLGNMVIPARNLEAVRHGGSLAYFFQVQRPGQSLQFRNAGVDFQMKFIDEMSFPVHQLGSVAVVPDSYVTDGKTTISFAPGALSNAGTLVVKQKDPAAVPAGPGGLNPVVAYSFELEGTRLERDAQISLTYPSNADGSVVGFNGAASNLAPYWLQGGGNWLVLGPRQFDSSAHTVSATTTHFSTFALFLSGAVGAADLRPMQRVVTPNGDGINDTIDFNIGSGDTVQLFDLRGHRVRALPGPNPRWDGRDDNGSIVEGGLYIYQYTLGGERVSGVIVVAR